MSQPRRRARTATQVQARPGEVLARGLVRVAEGGVLAQWLRFAAVGATNTLLSWCAYALLTWQGLHYALASSVAFGLGVLNSYVLNRRWTFRSRAKRAPELLRFGVVQIIGLGADLGLLYAMVERLGIHHLLAQALAFPAASAVTYGLSRRWAFGARDE